MSDWDDGGDNAREWAALSPNYKRLISVARWCLLALLVLAGMGAFR